MASQETQQYKFFNDKLELDDERSSALNDIKLLLSYVPSSEAVAIIQSTGLAKMFKCLSTSDNTSIELTCEVLKTCFEKFEPGVIVKTYTSNVMYLLRHENLNVRKLAIHEVSRTITKDTILLPLPKYIDVYVAAAQMVCEECMFITNKAVFITSNLPIEAYDKILEEMKIALECNSSSKCNAYEIIINISTKSYDIFNICVNKGYFDFMINDLQSDDILCQLNILELLSQLAIKPYGISYLIKQGTLHKISESVVNLKQNSLSYLLLPGYMKFFGTIAHYYPKEIFEKYPVLTDFLFDTLDSNDTCDSTILPVAIDTLGFIGTTLEGKMCLMALGNRYTSTIEKLGTIIKNSTTEMKIRALHCMVSLIGVEEDPKAKLEPIDHRISLMTREWFRSLSKQPNSMVMLFDICKNPFPDIKLAGLNLLDSVCQHNWGAEMVASVAGFIEYLLDRTTESIKESKEAKYNVIKRLSQTTAFDENITNRLQQYVQKGPFYSEIQTQIALEEE